MHPMLIEMIAKDRSAEIARASAVPRPHTRRQWRLGLALRLRRQRIHPSLDGCAPRPARSPRAGACVAARIQ